MESAQYSPIASASSATRPAQGSGTAGGEHKPQGRFAAGFVIARQGLPVQPACRVLMVSQAGCSARRSRPPSERSIRHAWTTHVLRSAGLAATFLDGGSAVSSGGHAPHQPR